MALNQNMFNALGLLMMNPGEAVLNQQDRVSFQLTWEAGPNYPAGDMSCSQGTAVLTNQRFVYCATKPTAKLQSLVVPLANIKKMQVKQPIFGANYVTATVIPVRLELKLFCFLVV